jgi:hypothetical protein
MRIVFLCGSLEPGHDGVGDYSRRLAGELTVRGHQVCLIAINDRKIKETIKGTQQLRGVLINTVRLPSFWPVEKKMQFLQPCINEFNPAWISLQFVPFAFQDKGLPFWLAGMLLKIGAGRRWHFMFHELWVGMNKEASISYKWWGLLQRMLISVLVKKIKPVVIHTQTELYLEQLRLLGFASAYLPLFSNIPVVTGSIKKEADNTSNGRNKEVVFVLFAGIHAGAPVDLFANDIASYSRENLTPVKLIMIGRNGTEQDKWAASWHAQGMQVQIMGEQPAESISSVFSKANVGITTTPFALAEKSGAVAAMQEHGLPVVCVSYPWTPRGIKELVLPERIMQYPHWNINTCIAGQNCNNGYNSLSTIATSFVETLTAAQ